MTQSMYDNKQHNRDGADPDEGLHRNKHMYVGLVECDVANDTSGGGVIQDLKHKS